jgi:hypothetical protein
MSNRSVLFRCVSPAQSTVVGWCEGLSLGDKTPTRRRVCSDAKIWAANLNLRVCRAVSSMYLRSNGRKKGRAIVRGKKKIANGVLLPSAITQKLQTKMNSTGNTINTIPVTLVVNAVGLALTLGRDN